MCCVCACSGQKGGKDFSEETLCEWSSLQNTDVCSLYLFYVSDSVWGDLENAAGDKEQRGKEKGMSKATKTQETEEVYEEQPLW